ncbi:MAG: 2-oxoacid:acceptor oxidoreductase family protein [Candidatus Eisenbacteria bacterium]|uniref:2-oxoacid:acceptor oxidoreductase family protein n=1 Tax=Eiseniibacteriota bacterium TaxID=2212470 RepID=A0A956NGW8_UNCEI|nr:2-oxoacid:acceptor oxidoreductase family protein [Candidatus Eisenbacteria bacterium]
MDGNTAVIMCERESSDAAGAYPITPSTQMGEYWAEAAAAGHVNVSGRPLIFVEPEGEHAAAAVTAGMSMTGLRAANFSSGQGIAYMHESLYAAVGKRLTYILNIGARAMTKATLNVHAGHDDYHCIDDTGFFQLFAKNAQAAADLNIIAHRIAELSLTPGALAQDGFLTTHLIESIMVPERALIDEYLGRPEDEIDTPTPAQRIIYGPKRRRIPVLWDVDNPIMAGLVQNQDSYMQSVAAQRPFFFDHIQELTDRAMGEFEALTGREYRRVMTYRAEDAEYLILGQGSVVPSAEVVTDYLRNKGIKVGVVDMVMFRPFPSDLVAKLLRGRKGVAVLERLDQPLAVDLPLAREIRATMSKCLENGQNPSNPAYPELDIYRQLSDAPPIYSGSFGMGSRDLQPEGVIGAVENMLDKGAKKRFFYLSVDFLRDEAITPKQEVYQDTIAQSYPKVKELAVKGSENPNLMPEGAITVRFHSVGGWGAITTGKNLAMTLFDLLGYHIKANPKYGSEKKGQPTTYYLSAAPEPIRVNCEYFYVDVVLSPDPNVFHHTNALAGLKEGGVFILQSDETTPEKVWQSIPAPFQKIIIDKKIKVFALDGFKIAREEASDPDLQLRMQGIAFQGAFFAASPVMKQAGLDEKRLLDAIHEQLEHKFGNKGRRVVEDNMRVVKRGWDENMEILPGAITESKNGAGTVGSEPDIPVMVKTLPQSKAPMTDIHRFWEQTGNFYMRGQGNDNLTDPFIGLGIMPASSALFRDMTQIRFTHPEWIPENCTACGDCYTVCPDTAIPGLVNEVGQVLDTAVKRVKKAGNKLEHLPKAARTVEQKLKALCAESAETDGVADLIDSAIEQTFKASKLEGDERDALRKELDLFKKEIGSFQFALTRPYFTNLEKQGAGEGGLFSITVNPYTCKGCMECVEVCNDDALRSITQTGETVKELQKNWNFWLDLPTTPKKYSRIDDIEEGIGALETLLLDKANYLSFSSGDGACLGCSEKTVMHLFTGTIEALMQPRIEKHVTYLDDLIGRLEKSVHLKLAGEIDLSDPEKMSRIMSEIGDGDVTLAGIAQKMEKMTGGEPIDQDWLRRVTQLIGKLKALRWKYEEGTTGRGRSKLGMINATGCTSVWGSTYPFNPYPFPWTNHLFQDSPSMAMGIFEGHMAKMADGFKAIRMAELELSGQYAEDKHGEFFTYFNWHQFTDEEWELCPPVVSVGGDGAMYDIGFQNLSRAMASGKPIKILVVDTQVYSNTGGQACTSGFIGQVSDMAQYGKAIKGKEEPRKEIGLIGMAHRTTYVMQSAISNPSHMIEGFIKGLKARRPALFNLYSSCQPEHGIGDDLSAHQAKLAVESRAYPIFRYDPDAGKTPEECFDLEGNPSIDVDWPTYKLKYKEGSRDREMELPMTFADFALTEVRFRKHFRMAPQDTWNENMVPLAEFLDMAADEREGLFPFVWSVDKKNHLIRLLVSKSIVESCEDRRDFWIQLRALAGIRAEECSRDELETQVRNDVVGRIAAGLMQWAGGEGGASLATLPAAAPTNGAAAAPAGAAPADANGYMAPWIDTDQCTSCDECIKINNKVFAYNASKKAFIQNPDGGSYKDLVKAAEKCTARVIHPGLPKARTEKDIDKWIARGEKFN